MLLDSLTDLGLTEKESRVYLELLELGTQPASVIARRHGIARSTAQFLLETLTKKSFVKKVVKNSVTHYTAQSPETLTNILEFQKNAYLEETTKKHERLTRLIPLLAQLETRTASSPKVQYYEGLDGLKTMIEDGLRADLPIYSVIDAEQICEPVMQWLRTSYGPRRRAQASRLESRTLIQNASSQQYLTEMFGREGMTVKYLKRVVLDLPIVVQVYGDRVGFYAVSDERDLHGVLIESPMIARTIKSLMVAIW